AVARDGRLEHALDVTEVTFRPLSADQIAAYVATGEPMDKAGAYAIQGQGAALVEGIRGDFFSVMGLPLRLALDLLERFGLPFRLAFRLSRAVSWSRADCMARSASSSWAIGAPHRAMIASPMNLSSVPPFSNTISTISVK